MVLTKRYLIKANFFLLIPKLFTGFLKLITIISITRVLGIRVFGQYSFLESASSLILLFAEFGMPYAIGKIIAKIKNNTKINLFNTYLKWLKTQFLFVIIGIISSLLIIYKSTAFLNIEENRFYLSLIISITGGSQIILYFNNSVLNNIEFFKKNALLMSSFSITKSIISILVIYKSPTLLNYSLGICFNAVIYSLISILITINSLTNNQNKTVNEKKYSSVKLIIQESSKYLWMRLATQAFNSLPNIVLGKSFGSSFLGIFNSFKSLTEIVNLPFLVLGNSLMIKVNEIISSQKNQIHKIKKIIIVSTLLSSLIALAFYFLSDTINFIFFKNIRNGSLYIKVLSPGILFLAISSVIAPMGDYLKGLTSRSFFLSLLTISQALVLYKYSNNLGEFYSLIVIVIFLLLQTIGYSYITWFNLNSSFKEKHL